jgi:hypothetical protein
MWGTPGRAIVMGKSKGSGSLHPAIAAAILGGGLLLLTLTVLMAFLLVELKESGEHIESQDEKVSNVYRAGRKLVAETKPAIEEAAPALRDVRPAVGRIGPLTRDAKAALEPLAPAAPALANAARRLGPLSSAGMRLVSTAIPLLEGFDAPRLIASIEIVGDLASRLAEGDRLVKLVDEARVLVGEIEDRDLPRKAAKSSHRLRDALEVLRTTLSVQRRTLRVQRRSVSIQRQSLVHIESIDRKTGGTVPGSSGTP